MYFPVKFFVLYLRVIFPRLDSCVIFFVLYFRVVYYCVVYFGVVFYKLYLFPVDFLLHCTYPDFFNFYFRVVLY